MFAVANVVHEILLTIPRLGEHCGVLPELDSRQNVCLEKVDASAKTDRRFWGSVRFEERTYPPGFWVNYVHTNIDLDFRLTFAVDLGCLLLDCYERELKAISEK